MSEQPENNELLPPGSIIDLASIQIELASELNKPFHEQIRQFESIAEQTLCCHSLAINSATSGLHLALLALGVGLGDYVICSTFTFVASANPIMYQGAQPVFIDSEQETWNMDPELLDEALSTLKKENKNCKAVIVPHIYGMPSNLKLITETCWHYQVPIIEDAAQAFGSKYQNRFIGTFGDIGVYSFNTNKVFSLMGGGLMVSKNLELLNRAKYFATQAKMEKPYYLHKEVGYNYAISPIQASIGYCLWRYWPEKVNRRRETFSNYFHFLKDIPEISFQLEPLSHYSNRWRTTILIEDKLDVNLRLRIEKGLARMKFETKRLWKPLHAQPVFKGAHFYNKGNANRLFDNGLSLPSTYGLGSSQIERICEIIENSIRN